MERSDYYELSVQRNISCLNNTSPKIKDFYSLLHIRLYCSTSPNVQSSFIGLVWFGFLFIYLFILSLLFFFFFWKIKVLKFNVNDFTYRPNCRFSTILVTINNYMNKIRKEYTLVGHHTKLLYCLIKILQRNQ